MNTKTYVRTCITGMLGLLACTALLNRLVDPFWYYRDVDIRGFNSVKTQFHKYERHIKPVILRDIKPKTVIFSNSFLEIGFNPLHPALTRDGASRSYNFAMAGSGWDRTFCNVVYALNNTQMETAIIGVYPGPMPTIDCAKRFADTGKVKQTALLLSFDALRSSYKTIIKQGQKPTHTLEGMLFYHRDKGDRIEETFNVISFKYMSQRDAKACAIPGHLDMPAWSYPEANEDLSGLRALLKLLVEQNIRVKLVVYPFHALWMETVMNCEGVMGRWHSLYRLAAAVDEINRGEQRVELWDFQGMSSFLTEEIRNNQVKYWQDHGHFNHEMGDVMLDIIYHRIDPRSVSQGDEFGVLLTKESVPDRYHRFVTRRAEFLKDNPWFIQANAKFQSRH